MTLSKQVSCQGLVIHRVMLTWGPSPRYTGEKTVSERLTYQVPGETRSQAPHIPGVPCQPLCPQTYLTDSAAARLLRTRVLPNVKEAEITWFLITLSPSTS